MAYLQLFRHKILETVEPKRIVMKIYNEKTKIFEKFGCERDQFEPMMRWKLPQTIILDSSRLFVQRLIGFLGSFVGDTSISVRVSEKKVLEVSGKLDSVPEETMIKRSCLGNLDTFLYMHKNTGWDVTNFLGSLAVDSPQHMETIIDFFCRKKLQTVLMGSPTARKETGKVGCLVRLLKGIRKVNHGLFQTLTQRMRVILTNIGANPTRKAVYNFCVRRDHPARLFIRFFKSSLGIFSRKKDLAGSADSADR